MNEKYINAIQEGVRDSVNNPKEDITSDKFENDWIDSVIDSIRDTGMFDDNMTHEKFIDEMGKGVSFDLKNNKNVSAYLRIRNGIATFGVNDLRLQVLGEHHQARIDNENEVIKLMKIIGRELKGME
ncbi:hypothetical protein [Paracoccus sulfuroxidans]|uniref:Uncharacterized protein n=1 Tax=Paracoccus sulfuroxidans TaxID=384678 RepID=A0A562P1E1_9RHOB|nr:hypothetical protein [Paracoccus sulfuroxidans]TWI38219.1 hypothetical protein IQ24_00357 [Paracoccus sulfuroxidans]